MDKFWKSALAVGGVATIGAFVFFSLYKEWLTLGIFERLTSSQTFIVMLVFLVLVFLVAAGMLVAWFFEKDRYQKLEGESSVSFTIPRGCSFKRAAIALASEEGSTVEFNLIPDDALETILKSQTLKASSTKRAIELLHGLAVSEFPNYTVTLTDGKYSVTGS